MVRVCLDLDVVVDYLLGDDNAKKKVSIYLESKDAELCISATTLAELAICLRDPSILEEIKELLTILPFNEDAATKARDVYDYLEETYAVRGAKHYREDKLSMSQIYLAATCLAHNALLVTKDKALREKYSRVPGLKIV